MFTENNPSSPKKSHENEHIVVLLDLDDTLFDYYRCTNNSVFWIGGSPDVWMDVLNTFKEKAKEVLGYTVHFGLCSYKPQWLSPAHEQAKVRGDQLSAAALGDEAFLKYSQEKSGKTFGVSPVHSLKILIDVIQGEPLAIFTNKREKVEFGMKVAKQKIEDEFKTTLKTANMWIADDSKEVLENAAKAGHPTLDAKEMAGKSIAQQKEILQGFADKLFSTYGLDQYTPKITIDSADYKEIPTKAPEEEPVSNRSSPPPTGKGLRTLTDEELKAEGIMGLDDEPAEEPTFGSEHPTFERKQSVGNTPTAEPSIYRLFDKSKPASENASNNTPTPPTPVDKHRR